MSVQWLVSMMESAISPPITAAAMMVVAAWLMGLPRQSPPPGPPLGLGLGLGRSRGRPLALIGQGEPLSLLAPVIARVAHVVPLLSQVVSLPAHVVQ